MKFLKSVPSIILLAAILVTASPSASVSADVNANATIVVTSNMDTTVNDGVCTLREAIIAANSNTTSGGAVGECIAGSASGTDTITFAGNYTITLGSQLPAITSPIIINGNGAGNTIVQASTCNPVTLPGGCTPAAYRVFQVNSGRALTLNQLTVRHGNLVGGGIFNGGGNLTITNSIISNNNAVSGGGIYTWGALTITNSTISNNGTNSTYGGGIFNATSGTTTITNSVISGNTGENGGGIYNNAGTLTITNSEILNNGATSGGGVFNGLFDGSRGTTTVTNSAIFVNNATAGGGFYNDGTLTITNSAILSNTATTGGGVYNTDKATVRNSTFSDNGAFGGGGLFNEGTGNLIVANSTITGNTAFVTGGGISNDSGVLTLTNATITGNGSIGNGGGIYVYNGGTLNYRNTIIANSTNGGDCVVIGTISANTSNLVEDGSCSPAFSGDPNLGPLADNGGPTLTHALAPSSPAIDKGNAAVCKASPVNNKDQRGVSRKQGLRCDIGAYEYVFEKSTFKSQGTNDGWILESSETSGKGGTLNKSASTFNLGDDAANKQYRAILSFNTSGLPDTAVIVKVTLKVKRQGVVGDGNPVNIFKGFMVDIKNGSFGTPALKLGDFKTSADMAMGAFKPSPSSGWYALNLTSGKEQINKTGLTQLRLRFKLDDNNDNIANFLSLYSGNAGAANRPQLIVEYYIP